MDIDLLLKITKWTKLHHNTLHDLYIQYKADTGDTKTSFPEFAAVAYSECAGNEKELPKPKTIH